MYDTEDYTKRDELISQYRDFVTAVAKKMIRNMSLPPKMLDEYEAAGYLGLVEAAERYNPNAGHDFRSYAFLRIRGSIIDSIRQSSELSSTAYRYSKALAAANDLKEELISEQHRSDDPKKILDTQNKLAKILNFTAKAAVAYKLSMLDAEEEIMNVQDLSDTPEKKYFRKDQKKKLNSLIAKLDPREQVIIREYYLNEKSFAEIVNEYEGMSKSWVSRLHARALENLKKEYCKAEHE